MIALESGSFWLAVGTALVLMAALVLERAALRWRWTPYFTLGLPLGLDLVPIPTAPTGEGRTESVRWEVADDVVRFWAEPGERAAPTGLHGAVRLVPTRGAVGLVVRWSPPLSYVLATGWLVVLGAARGQLPMTGAIAALILGGVLLAYRRFAERAARELRWAFVKE